jgi:hypothetical protein
MRTLFVGDVHGCPRALGSLLELAEPTRVIVLGDIFAKGPDPAGVWSILQDVRAEGVLGNHDARMLQAWQDPQGESAHHAACRALPEAARAWTEALPIFLPGDGWVAVHAGLHPKEGVAGTARRMALVLRRWPDDSDPTNPFWWEAYAGPPRVFYGHDAMRGVQLHPWSVGLDSGCVYGGPLSGYLLEEERLLQVPGGE